MAKTDMIQNAEAINENVKEDATMANENVIAEEIETIEAPAVTLPKFNDVLVPADEPREMLLITATRNKNDAMFWSYFLVPAGVDPKDVIKNPERKFVNLVDARNVTAFIEAGAPLRGMASTISDFAARYAKTKGEEVTDKVALILREFTDIIAQVDAGTFEGTWVNPEAIAKAAAKAVEEAEKAAKKAEKAAKKAAAEAPAEDVVEDPFEVEE